MLFIRNRPGADCLPGAKQQEPPQPPLGRNTRTQDDIQDQQRQNCAIKSTCRHSCMSSVAAAASEQAAVARQAAELANSADVNDHQQVARPACATHRERGRSAGEIARGYSANELATADEPDEDDDLLANCSNRLQVGARLALCMARAPPLGRVLNTKS
jgi:hypothetical protein